MRQKKILGRTGFKPNKLIMHEDTYRAYLNWMRTVKPGIQTTEFWLAFLVAVLGGLATIYAEADWAKIAGIVSATLVSLGYGNNRALVKRAAMEKEE